MAVTLESNTQTEAELTDALVKNGLTPTSQETEEKTEEGKVEEKKPSEPTEVPGEKVPAEAEGKTATETEAVETKSQETTQEEAEEVKKKSKGGFQSKNEKLTRQLGEAREELELERGDKTALRKRVEELEAKLADNKPAEADKPKELVRPKRPELPELAEFDFDQEKYSAAMKTYRKDMSLYDDEMDAYHEAKAEKKVNAALEGEKEKTRAEKEQEAQQKAYNGFVSKKDAGRQNYDDWDDVIAEAEDMAFPPAIQGAIFESENPADLLYHFAKNPKELERFESLNPLSQVREITRLEDRIVAARTTEPKEESKAAPEKKDPPAKEQPKRVETPDAPITPVGSRAQAKGKNFDEQLRAASESGDSKEFNRIRALQMKEQAAARV